MRSRCCSLAHFLIFAAVFMMTALMINGTADPAGDLVGPTTELTCNFGMPKGQRQQSCTIAVPQGCTIANFPETTKPWSSISKGGQTMCRFDDKGTDWKTRVTGTCERCKTVQCSARFSIMVRCGG